MWTQMIVKKLNRNKQISSNKIIMYKTVLPSGGNKNHPKKRHPEALLGAHQQPQTDDTLGDPVLPSPTAYLEECSLSDCSRHQTKLLKAILSHCNLKWMEDLLARTIETGAQQSTRNQMCFSEPNSEQTGAGQGSNAKGLAMFTSSIESLQDQVTCCLVRIRQKRKILMRELPELLLRSSATFSRKHATKTNLARYLELLESLKTTVGLIKGRVKTEEDYEEHRDKLRGSGIVVVSEVLSNCLLKSADRFICSRTPFRVNNLSNLESIGHDQLARCAELGSGQSLYPILKKYVFLRKYLVYTGQQEQGADPVDLLFQHKIRQLLGRVPSRISNTEFQKCESLVQGSRECSLFLMGQAQQMRQELHNLVKQSIQNSRRPLDEMGFEGQMSETLQHIESRLFLIQEEESVKMVASLAIAYLNAFFLPVMKYLCRSHKQASRRQDRYRRIRIIQFYYLRYAQIVGKILVLSRLSEGQMEQEWGCKLHGPDYFFSNNALQSILQKTCHSSHQIACQFKSLSKNMVRQWNQNCGRSIIYVGNKMQGLLVQSLRSVPIKGAEAGGITVGADVQDLWISLVAEDVCQHMMREDQESGCLHQITFFRSEIALKVASLCEYDAGKIFELQKKTRLYKQCKQQESVKVGQPAEKAWRWYSWQAVNQKTMNTESSLHSRQKTGVFDQSGEQEALYGQLMLMNLKTTNYDKVMEISQHLGCEQEMNSLHQHLQGYFKGKRL